MNKTNSITFKKNHFWDNAFEEKVVYFFKS
jgi:hypothetical protein